MSVRLSKLPWAALSALLGLFALLFLADQIYAATLAWQFCLGALLLASGILLPGLMRREGRGELGLFATFGALVVMLHFTSFSPVKPFTRFYSGIHNGMTSGEVDELFFQNFPSEGKFAQPVEVVTPIEFVPEHGYALPSGETPTLTRQYTLDPSDGRYNAEMIVVSYRNDQVVGTSYLPD